jgi:hypothetical protein
MALLGAVTAVGALHACTTGPGREDVAVQRLETALCDKRLECGCALVDESFECGGWPPPYGLDESSSRAGLAFDPACIERWMGWLDRLSCQAPVLPRYAELCPLYHGTLREGEPCQGTALTDTDCDRGRFCIAGVCRHAQGTSFGAQDEPCDLGERCDDGLVCHDSSCRRLPGPDEPCLDYRCNSESSCIDDVCRRLPGPGASCDTGECAAGAFCSVDPVTGLSECLRAGDVGDPCQGHRQCVSGNCPAGFCEDPAAVGDPCDNQLPCGPGSLCAEGVCQAAEDGAVPTGSACDLLDTL